MGLGRTRVCRGDLREAAVTEWAGFVKGSGEGSSELGRVQETGV